MGGTSDEFDRRYALAREALGGLDVNVKHLDHIRGGGVPTNPMALMASFPAAYSVDAIALEHGINVMRYGRFGFTESGPHVIEFPTATDAEDAAERLAEVLRPYVEQEIAAAVADRASYTGDGPIESRDAIRKIS